MFVEFDTKELNQSPSLRECLWDVGKAAAFLMDTRLNRRSIPMRYGYCPIHDCFYVVWWTDGNFKMTKLADFEGRVFRLTEFQQMHAYYENAFITVREETNMPYTQEEFERIGKAWSYLYGLFIEPLTNMVPDNINFIIGFHCCPAARRYTIDFGLLHTYKYRMFVHSANENVLFITVSTDWVHVFVKNLIGIKFPTLQDIKIVYGFKPFDSPESLAAAPTQIRKDAAILRERIFTYVLKKAQSNGKGLVYLEGLDDLKSVFQSDEEPCYIQLLSHYHEKRLFTRSSTSIRFKKIVQLVRELKQLGTLRDDICVDVLTCTNFSDFRTLYEEGIKYLYLSHHKLSTDLVAYLLYELYSGDNARDIGWCDNYLDGRSLMQEAWTRINRCFYTKMAQGKLISTL